MGIRKRLLPVVKQWASVMMLTLTIDPKLFGSPEEAFRYVKEHRCVPRLIRRLASAGFLNSKQFFAVIEWQKNGMPHFHVLVEAEFVPHKELAKAWGRFRPKSASKWEGTYEEDQLKGMAPEFGHVRFSRKRSHGGKQFASPEHAANYATKYLTKHPEEGYPDWVLDFEGQIKRFSTSHGLLKPQGETTASNNEQEKEQPKREPMHAGTCFCDECRQGRADEERRRRRPNRTIRERLHDCSTQTVLRRVIFHKGEKGPQRIGCEFDRILPLTWDKVREMFDQPDEVPKFFLSDGEARWIGRFTRKLESVVGGGVNPGDVARFTEFDEWNAQIGVYDDEATRGSNSAWRAVHGAGNQASPVAERICVA
jgi:hypothetical protein